MEFIYFTEKSKNNRINDYGIEIEENYRGNGILIYPLVKIDFKANCIENQKEEKKLNSTLSIDETWEKIATGELRHQKKKIRGFILKLTSENWPMEVYIDVHSNIALDFATNFNTIDQSLVYYYKGLDFLDIVKNYKIPNYVMETSFTVNSEDGLKSLIKCFINAEGGIWDAHSFDCFLSTNIDKNSIIQTVDY